MADGILSLSSLFEDKTEADWLGEVETALKGGGLERITRKTVDGVAIRPLYRENDWPSATDPLGEPGAAPFLRGAKVEPDAHLPWDIRQAFTHPEPSETNREILRDLERGVSSVELVVDSTGRKGCSIQALDCLNAALSGVRADIAGVSLDHRGEGTGTSVAGLLALWAEAQSDPREQKLAFNMDVLGLLMRRGRVARGLDLAFARVSELARLFCLRFPLSTTLRVDARMAHEAGATEAQELAVLIAHGVDTMRRLQKAGYDLTAFTGQAVFTLSVGANYGLEIAKLRAARRLWARVLEAMDLDPEPMTLQAVSSARMLTRYDPWVNMLRNTAASFAASAGGADIVTVRPFNEAIGQPEELGRRIARNTQIMAMEESGLGRVADPAGGSWFEEGLADDLAKAAWAEFQAIESEGGLAESLIAGKLQARITEARDARAKDIARRKIPITGVSEFPLLDQIDAPVADVDFEGGPDTVSEEGLNSFLPELETEGAEDTKCQALAPIHLAEDFETLRDRAEDYLADKGRRPAVFLATLGPLAEHTARLDFARNLFAAGGIEGHLPETEPKTAADLASSFKASGARIAVICGSDKRYESEAEEAAAALKQAGAQRVWLAGKHEAASVDSHIFMGCNLITELDLALSEIGVA